MYIYIDIVISRQSHSFHQLFPVYVVRAQLQIIQLPSGNVSVYTICKGIWQVYDSFGGTDENCIKVNWCHVYGMYFLFIR